MSSDEVSESRRKWVQGTTAGLVASVALPTIAQTSGGAPDAGDPAPRDPRTLYPESFVIGAGRTISPRFHPQSAPYARAAIFIAAADKRIRIASLTHIGTAS